jgi:hypothetical protein
MVERGRYFSSWVDRDRQREGALTSRGARLSYSVKKHKHIDGAYVYMNDPRAPRKQNGCMAPMVHLVWL